MFCWRCWVGKHCLYSAVSDREAGNCYGGFELDRIVGGLWCG